MARKHPRHPRHPQPGPHRASPGGPGGHGPVPSPGVHMGGGPVGSRPAPGMNKPHPGQGTRHPKHPHHPQPPKHRRHPRPVRALPPEYLKHSFTESVLPPRLAARAPRGGPIPLFGNGDREVCGPAAVATSLLLSSGLLSTDAAVLDLYERSGGHGRSGVWMADLMTAVLFDGLDGHRAKVRLLTMMDAYGDGDVIELDGHAAVCLGGGVLMWGELRPFPAASPWSAWRLSW